jgi:hypothetical protein
MSTFNPSRSLLIRATLLSLLAGSGVLVQAQMHVYHGRGEFSSPMVMIQKQKPAPIVRQPPQASAASGAERRGAQSNGARAVPPTGGHLAEWMNQHGNLSPNQQQDALTREPGFHELPAATQQRLQNRLSQLNAMSPQERVRVIRRNEAMEHLSPDQRAQVRGAMQQLGALPVDQRKTVARAFRQLRDVPPGERMAAMNSERYAGQFNPAQRESLMNLLRIEPMLPPPELKPEP